MNILTRIFASEISIDSLPKTPGTGDGGAFITTAITVVIGIAAVISVLFIVIGGVRYVLSQGDPQAISKAKATIVFALIGLVIAVVAQAIVVMVINGVSS